MEPEQHRLAYFGAIYYREVPPIGMTCILFGQERGWHNPGQDRVSSDEHGQRFINKAVKRTPTSSLPRG